MHDPDLNAITALDAVGDPTHTRTYAVGEDGQPHSASVPPTVPGYEIEGELGRGGMGVVYKARDKKLDRPVALKIVLGGGHASPITLSRFLAEAKAAAAVRHPGIAQVYELGEHNGLPFLAMEYCPGGTLADKLGGMPFPPKKAAELIESLAIAVNAAHRVGVVHRDLKPANILLQVASGQRTADAPSTSQSTDNWSLATLAPMVSDFGLARQGDAGSGLTAPGAVLGSPSYMAPEQAEGKKEIGPGVDVYGLGAIFYECLTGRPPFRAVTPLETVMQVLKDDPVPPSRLVSKLPRDLETICLKCLQKDPRRRYMSAAELADDLRRFLDGRTIAARPAGMIEKTWKAAKRRPGAAAAIGATALALFAVVGVVVWKNQELQRERDDATAARNQTSIARDAAEGERNQAESARTRAEARLVVALDAIERMMVRMAGEKWARNPALQDERRAVLEEAIALYRGFSAEDSKDPRVLRQTALTEVRIAAARLTLAEYDKAGESITAAEKIQRQLRDTYPRDGEYANDLALTLVQAGHIHVMSARFDKAVDYYRRSETQAREAVALAQEQDDFKLTLAEALTALGRYNYNAIRGFEDSLKYHSESLRLARALAEKPNPGYGAQLFQAVSLMNVGYLEISQRRPGWREKYAEAEKILDALVGQPSPSARWADIFDNARGQLLTFQASILRMKNPGAALKKLDEGLGIFESLLAVQPKSFPQQVNKLNALSDRVDLLQQLNRTEESRKAIKELIAFSESVAADSPSMAWVRYSTSINRSLELVYRVRDGEVKDLEQEVAALQRLLPARDPEPARNTAADTVRYNIACVYAQAARAGPPEDREKWAVKAVTILETLARDDYFVAPSRVKHLDQDNDLDPIRDRRDYKTFAERLTAPREVAPPPRLASPYPAVPSQ